MVQQESAGAAIELLATTTRRLALLGSFLACAFWTAPSARLVAAGGGVTRTYYIAADEVVWDYAPSGANAAEGRAFNEAEKPWMEAGPHVAGRKAKKALYREYTDATFTTLKPRGARAAITVELERVDP